MVETEYASPTSVNNRDRIYRDLVLALESTGDLGCFDACVKNRITFCFLVLKVRECGGSYYPI